MKIEAQMYLIKIVETIQESICEDDKAKFRKGG